MVLFSNANSKCWSAISLAVSWKWGIFNKCITLFLMCFSLADLCGADNGCHAVADAYPDCYLCVGNNQRHHSIHVKVRLFWLYYPDLCVGNNQQHHSIHVKVRLFWLYYPDLCVGNNQQHHAIHVRVQLSWLYGDHNTYPDLAVCFGNKQWHLLTMSHSKAVLTACVMVGLFWHFLVMEDTALAFWPVVVKVQCFVISIHVQLRPYWWPFYRDFSDR